MSLASCCLLRRHAIYYFLFVGDTGRTAATPWEEATSDVSPQAATTFAYDVGFHLVWFVKKINDQSHIAYTQNIQTS